MLLGVILQNLSIDQSKNIPVELWFNIFRTLSPEDLGRLASVCHIFYSISTNQSVWEEVTKRLYPNTYIHLSERQVVPQQAVEGHKRRKLDPSTPIDWRQACLERVHFFLAAKKGQLQRTSLYQFVTGFDILDGRIYVGDGKKLVTFLKDQVGGLVNQVYKSNVNFVKAEKRKDGKTYVYTGSFSGEINILLFKDSYFKEKLTLQEHSSKIIGLESDPNFLISADSKYVCFWDKKTGEIRSKFDHQKIESGRPVNDGYYSLTLEQGKVYAGTTRGIIKIWDVHSLTLIEEIDVNKKFNNKHCIHHIKVFEQKIFYSSNEGIHILDLKENTLTGIISSIQSFTFDIFDGKLFHFKPLDEFDHGITIRDARTLQEEVEKPFSSDDSFISGIKVLPSGILYSSSNLYITERNIEEANDDLELTCDETL